MSKRKESDYFNLESSDESDQEEVAKMVKASKWDWDRDENFHLYYKTHWEDAATASKRPCEDDKPFSSKKLAKEEVSNEARIEPGDGSSDCLFQLVGHHSSVNRIHWAKATPNLLLSSSMDG